jgi:hypothetical protein
VNKLVLKLEGKVIELVGENGLYDLNHLRKQLLEMKESGILELTKSSSTFSSLQSMTDWTKYLSDQAKTEYQLESTRGRGAKTVANQKGVIAYAAWLNEGFRLVVEEAFVAAMSGDGKAAVDIATSVAIPPELLDREKVLRLQMNTLIDIEAGDDSRKRANLYTNFNRLIAKGVAGYTPTELTGGDVPTFKYIVEKGHKGGVSAYLATMELIITGLFAKLDYHTIALMLRVSTGKNKEIVGQLK